MSESSTTTGQGSSGGDKSTGRSGRWARLTLFMRQVIAELRKVIWPTRKELITYTWVVIVFVAVFAVIVGLYDWVFTYVVLRLFG